MDYDKFTREQILFITFIGICGNMSHTFTWSYYLAERSGWVVFGIRILLQIPFVMGILYICRNYAGYTIFDIIGESFGKFLHIIVVLIYSLITIALGIFMLNMFVGSVKIYFLPFTPSWIPMLFIVFMGILLVNNRILLFGRIFELLSIWFIINYFTGFSLSFVKKFKIENVIPVFDIYLLKFVKGILFSMGNASEILLTIILFLIALLIFLPSTWLNSSNTAYFLSIFTTSFIVLPFAIIVMMLACLGICIIKKGLVVTKIEKNKNFVNYIKFDIFVYRMLGLC